MKQSTVELTPKFMLDSNLKRKSEWSSTLLNRKEKTIQENIKSGIQTVMSEKISDYGKYGEHHYGGLEGWWNSRQQSIDNMKQYGEEVKKSKNKLLCEIHKITLSIAPYSQVRKIPIRLLDRTIRDERYEYYKAEFGMNITVPRGRVNQIRFYLTVLGDRKESEKAQVMSGFPNDLIERVNVVGGSLKIGVNNLLNIIPEPLVQTLGNFIQIDLNPWTFKWGYNKIKVLFSEGNNHKVDWFLSSKNLNQDFSCSITLKKRKTVKEVIGRAYAIWEYEPHKDLKDIAKKLIGRKNVKFGSDKKEITIIS